MSQERNKEPALILEVACNYDAAVYIEKNRRKRLQASLHRFFSGSFSACFARSRSCAPQTAPFVRGTSGYRRFCCGSAIVKPARFAAAKRRSPRGRNRTTTRQADGTAIASAKRIEKESGDQRIELARIPEIHSLFRIACRGFHAHKSTGFRVGLREGLWPSKAASLTSPLLSSPSQQKAAGSQHRIRWCPCSS